MSATAPVADSIEIKHVGVQISAPLADGAYRRTPQPDRIAEISRQQIWADHAASAQIVNYGVFT